MGELDHVESLSFLENLSKMLQLHHGKRVIILIDEYDAPINESIGSGCADDVLGMMRKVFSTALKKNDALEFAIVTGVMQIAKEAFFSGLNNLEVNSIFSEEFDEMFGFTDEEVRGLCEYYGHPEKYEEAKRWYDGYRFGNSDVYNPWSVLKYVAKKFKPDTYWGSTSGNSIIGSMLDASDDSIYAELERMSEGECLSKSIRTDMTIDGITNPHNIFSVMVMSGYLKAVKEDGRYHLSMPNLEMYTVFSETILYGISFAGKMPFIVKERINL